MAGLSPVAARTRSVRSERDLRPVAALLGAGVATITILGGVNALVVRLPLFDVATELDRQLSIPVIVSGGLLFAASALAAILHVPAGGGARWAWLTLGALFAFLGVDELVSIHEQLESAAGVDWQLLYAPLGLIAAVAWLTALGSMRDPVAGGLWIAAAAAWALSQLLEPIRYMTDTPEVGNAGTLADALTGIEEVLELAGSALFVLALLAAGGWAWRNGAFARREPGVPTNR